MSKEIENGRVCRIQKVGEVMGAVALNIILKEFNGSFLQVLKENDVFFTNLIVELTLKTVFGGKVTWADPERFFFHLVRHYTNKLDWKQFVFIVASLATNLLSK